MAGRREDVLEALRAAPAPTTVAQLADALGVHGNTVRFHLDALVREHRVERVAGARGTRGRPADHYRVAPGMDPTGTRRYRTLAEILALDIATQDDPDTRALEAGRRWGAQLAGTGGGAATDRMVGLLDELGFEPRVRDDAIDLHHCPFLELARTAPGVVCPLHLGIMRGAFDAWRAPVTVSSLEPFVEPDRCTAHLVARSAA